MNHGTCLHCLITNTGPAAVGELERSRSCSREPKSLNCARPCVRINCRTCQNQMQALARGVFAAATAAVSLTTRARGLARDTRVKYCASRLIDLFGERANLIAPFCAVHPHSTFTHTHTHASASAASPGCIGVGGKRLRVDVAHGWHATRQRRRHRIVAVHDRIAVAVLH